MRTGQGELVRAHHSAMVGHAEAATDGAYHITPGPKRVTGEQGVHGVTLDMLGP